MTVAEARLARNVVLERRNQVEIVLRARHGDVQESPLFFDLVRTSRGELRRKITVGDIQNVDRVPFLSFGDSGDLVTH